MFSQPLAFRSCQIPWATIQFRCGKELSKLTTNHMHHHSETYLAWNFQPNLPTQSSFNTRNNIDCRCVMSSWSMQGDELVVWPFTFSGQLMLARSFTQTIANKFWVIILAENFRRLHCLQDKSTNKTYTSSWIQTSFHQCQFLFFIVNKKKEYLRCKPF